MARVAVLLPLAIIGLADAAVAPPVWPMPSGTATQAADCGKAPSLSLASVDLAVSVARGSKAAAIAYIQAAYTATAAGWGCPLGAQASSDGTPMKVTVQDASCASPACYTHKTDEAYSLSITKNSGVVINTKTLIGVAWAFSTLASLADGTCSLTCLPIKINNDKPAFGHRGLLLDTARRWFSVDDIKTKILDPMHRAKLNVLHWHIYDAQSQPLEVQFNAKLWQPYSPTQRYSQQDAKDLVAYAWSLGIRVLPEFDVPGHSTVWLAAYPQLVSCANKLPWDGAGFPNGYCNQPPCGQLKPSKSSATVVSKLLKEMQQVFPNYIISTGADEVNFNCWNEEVVPMDSPGYPSFERASIGKLKSFQSKVLQALTSAGRSPAVWDESFSKWKLAGSAALPKGSVLLAWQAPQDVPAMTAAGYNVVQVPYRSWYLDCGIGTRTDGPKQWCAPFNNWSMIYEQDPLEMFTPSSGGDPSRVIGGEVAMWTEHVAPSVLDYVVWPRAAALAERLWSPRSATKSAAKAAPRLQRFADQLAKAGLRPSALSWTGQDFRFFLVPQWCDYQRGAVTDVSGHDYCSPAKSYFGLDLTFDNLIET